MRSIFETKYNFIKKAAPVLALILLLVSLAAAGYPVYEHHHDCHGEDCPICETVKLCEGLVKVFGTGLAGVITVFAAVLSVKLTVRPDARKIAYARPVSEKVRLND